MKRALVVACVAVVGLLVFQLLPERTATGDSEWVMGDLSMLAETWRIQPRQDGKYRLSDFFHILLFGQVNMHEKITGLANDLANIKQQVANLALGGAVSVAEFNHLEDWIERELNRLWRAVNDLR